MQFKNLFFIFLSTLIGVQIAAESEDVQFWNQYILAGDISDDSNFFLEYQPRVGGDFNELNQAILRGAIGYKFNNNWSLMQGYGWIPDYNTSVGRNDEHRVFQQLNATHKFDNYTFINRTRFELRYLESPSDTSIRLRHFFKVNYQPGGWKQTYLTTYDELFFNLNSVDSPGLKSGVDQNRLFLGLGYKFSEMLTLETGYLYNYIVNEDQDITNHICYLGLFFNI